jgi:hypothetical protein
MNQECKFLSFFQGVTDAYGQMLLGLCLKSCNASMPLVLVLPL